MMLKIKKLTSRAMSPMKMAGSAAYDLYSNETVVIPPRERGIVGTGVAIAFPRNYVGRICDRSGMAWGKGLHVLAGVIDPNYRGEWKVVFYNTSDKPVTISRHARMAQVLFYAVANWGVIEVEELSDTERGSGGFGSTGDA